MLEDSRDASGKIVTFRVGEGRFGFALGAVHGIRKAGDESGTIAFRERDLPVVDLGGWLYGRAVAGPERNYIVVGREGELAAARIGPTGEVLSDAEVMAWPALCRALVGNDFSGVVRQGRDTVLVIDSEGILREARKRKCRSAGEADRDEL